MNVLVAAGGRFHAFALAQQLEKRGALNKLVTFSQTSRDCQLLPAKRIYNITSCAILDQVIARLHLNRIFSPSKLNVLKDSLFDRRLKKKLLQSGPVDIFTGWANYVLESIPAARALGAKIIVESGSCHILYQQALLKTEFEKRGINYDPICKQNRDRMLAEYESADYIMTLSSFARQSFIAMGQPEGKVLTASCGADLSYFTEARLSPPKKFRVLFVGQVQLRKGVQYLLEAWQQLALPVKSSELVIAGVEHKDFILAKQHLPVGPNVIFTGGITRSALRDLYANSSLFVLPSLEEGFGMVIGEAMAVGLPVIGSRNSAAPDIITHGIDGLLVPAGNANALAQEIAWVYHNALQASHLGQQGKETIKNFSWENYGTNIFRTYQSLL